VPAASSWTKAWPSLAVVQRGMVQAPRPLRKQPVADMEEELAKGGTCAGEDKEEHGEGGDDGYGSE
jgi:hypothetical protein